jgi:hypothetical protein
VQGGERVVHRDGVVGDVHGAQQTAVEVPVLGPAQQSDRANDPVVAAAAAAVQAVPVVRDAVAVERDADLDVEFLEHIEMPGVQLHAICVNTEVERGHRDDGANEFRTNVSHSGGAHEKGLSAVQDHRNGGEFLFLRIVRESAGHLPECFLGDEGGATFPALIGVLVHITVITGEVASAVDLEDELLELHSVQRSLARASLVPRTR